MDQDTVMPLGGLTLPFVEDLYRRYQEDRNSVSAEWRDYFDALGRQESISHSCIVRQGDEVAVLQDRVDQLVEAYRLRGHMVAHLDPLSEPPRPLPELDPAHYGLTPAELDQPVSCAAHDRDRIHTLRDLIAHLRATYCGTIGVEFMHIDEPEIHQWIQGRLEETGGQVRLPPDQQLRVLTLLTKAVVFEEYVRKKYIGAKSFSLEGCESLIPLLDTAIEKAGADGVEEIVMGMAHRGRLNVLVNVLGKRPQDVFREFEGVDSGSSHGDVRYHLGYNADLDTSSGNRVHLSLTFNPSHLEFVNPVVLGRVRAKQDRRPDRGREKVLGLLIHGDASFAGEGIVQETLNLSELTAYATGGTIHVIVNNQIGFTTPPSEARSSCHATAIGKMLQIPVFHVNGDDPEAVTHVMSLTMDFCRRFQRDAIIDMYGYRRHGHNEADEPSFTQPLMYRAIRARPSVRDIYLEKLLRADNRSSGGSPEQAEQIAAECRETLDAGLSAARSESYAPPPATDQGVWKGYEGGMEADTDEAPTGVDEKQLVGLLGKLTALPDSFHLHRLLERSMARRREMALKERPLDWSAGEALAIASLATEGIPVRLTGQDTARGTFGQRHAVLHDAENGQPYESFAHLADDQAPVTICNSPLSEAGVLGFEYGYSLDFPDGLVMWEAQFGDFANAAQVFIDQFIAGAEAKWRRLSGLVLLLPHGWEGQGPEHTSARLERFLTLAAENNIQIVNATTPAQYFHVLRRQVLRRWRKPLIILTPKSLVRHPRAVSDLEELSLGSFQRVIPDDAVHPSDVGRIILCSGKVYYDLLAHREEKGRQDVALVRVEQLYPFPDDLLRMALAQYMHGTPAVWVQEEPENMGAWRFLRCRFGETLFGRLPFDGVYRPAAPTPATGSKARHKHEQQQITEWAFSGAERRDVSRIAALSGVS